MQLCPPPQDIWAKSGDTFGCRDCGEERYWHPLGGAGTLPNPYQAQGSPHHIELSSPKRQAYRG